MSRRSPSMISTRSLTAARLAISPVDKSSKTRTRSPFSTNASAMLEPMKPAPPVTKYIHSPLSPASNPAGLHKPSPVADVHTRRFAAPDNFTFKRLVSVAHQCLQRPDTRLEVDLVSLLT